MNSRQTRHTAVARIALREGSCELALIPLRITDDSVPRRVALRTPRLSDIVDYLSDIGKRSLAKMQPPGLETGFCVV